MLIQTIELDREIRPSNNKNYKGFLRLQKTLNSHITFEGIGVHSGTPVRMNVYPADAAHGYVFVRSDQEGPNNRIKAAWNTVSNTAMCTKISNGFTSVSTIEHIVAALWGCDIFNALIEVNGPEVPIMDGSSDLFVQAIKKVGTCDLAAYVPLIEIQKPVKVENKNGWARFSPATRFQLDLSFNYGGRLAQEHSLSFNPQTQTFEAYLASARTFGFYEDGQKLKEAGLALGASFDNTVVLDSDATVMNKEGLRFDDEFIRHKMLDAIGDLALAGGYILGHFEGCNSGHGLNNEILRAIFSDPTAWKSLTMPMPLI